MFKECTVAAALGLRPCTIPAPFPSWEQQVPGLEVSSTEQLENGACSQDSSPSPRVDLLCHSQLVPHLTSAPLQAHESPVRPSLRVTIPQHWE